MVLSWPLVVFFAVTAVGVALFRLPVEKILKDFLVWIKENLGPWGPLVLLQPIFPGDSVVDQLIEIIKVLGTPAREEIQCMNRNYTVFVFRHIKAHPWHNFTIVLLLRHLVMVGAANQFAFSLLTVYWLRASGILLPFLRCHEAHLRDPAGTEAVPPAAAPASWYIE
ncbi:unnamed protein product [Miscanthus lutarioriparius]|uniref:Uncharacterized protein n=1 Tax=Miscanthus lutarioriparius TaxID=422564 RepID=A0A811PWE2_9POAL|nr:unnamed protein product [Miscanthus lutarioriparius]